LIEKGAIGVIESDSDSTKEELEILIHQNGGHCVQKIPTEKTPKIICNRLGCEEFHLILRSFFRLKCFFLIVHHVDKCAKKGFDIIKPAWIRDCVEQQQILEYDE
jgi:hypothetical protein